MVCMVPTVVGGHEFHENGGIVVLLLIYMYLGKHFNLPILWHNKYVHFKK